DMHRGSAAGIAGAMTPVPGGVGPMTIACLLSKTLTACCRISGLEDPKDSLPDRNGVSFMIALAFLPSAMAGPIFWMDP
ncbi:MAG: hypothetical protein EOS61_01385, partial [Mesorhizobium sp.]